MSKDYRIVATKRPTPHIMSEEEIIEWNRKCNACYKREIRWLITRVFVLFLIGTAFVVIIHGVFQLLRTCGGV